MNLILALLTLTAQPADAAPSPDCGRSRVLIQNVTLGPDSIKVPNYDSFPCLMNVKVESTAYITVDPPDPVVHYEPLTPDKIAELRRKGIIVSTCFGKECQ